MHSLGMSLSSIPIEFKTIWCFTKGLARYLKEARVSLVLEGGTFQSVVDQGRMIERFQHD